MVTRSRTALFILGLILMSSLVAYSQDDIQKLLEAHDPKTEAGSAQDLERKSDAGAEAGQATRNTAPGVSPTGADDQMARIISRLENIIKTLRKLVATLDQKSGGKDRTQGKDKGKGQDKGKGKGQGKGKDQGKGSTDDSAYVKKGSLKPENYGYDARYQPVFDIAEKFAQVNQKYVLSAGHVWKGYTGLTDCSGFVGHFYQTLMAAAGVKPAFPKNSWYPTSTTYKTQHTEKVTGDFPPTKPRDKIKPGDVFVLDKNGNAYGHTGIFIGYDRSGNPLIAHSTTTTIGSSALRGNKGHTGVRIEPIPSYYRERWAGFYRIRGTDQALDKLAKEGAR